MANTLPLDKMSVAEKIQAMESRWDDLCRKADAVSSPAWHEDVLTERDVIWQSGEEISEDWDVAKKNIEKKIL